MITGYKSVKPLIAKVYRDLQLSEEGKWASMIEWIAEALCFIGAYQQYIPKTTTLTITNKRVALPCDFYKIQQIIYGTIPLIQATGSFDVTTDCSDCDDFKTKSDYVYTMNNSYIYTNFDGEICISYLAIPTDEDGFPLIPDSPVYDEAIFRYIVTKLYYPDLLSGKIAPNLYDKLENDWNYKCMAARGDANMPSLDKLESIKNMWVRLIPDMNAHTAGFTTLNKQENINIGRK